MKGRWSVLALAGLLVMACGDDASGGNETGGSFGDADGDADGNDDISTTYGNADDGHGSGSVEETGFGMDDDMPLVASIPQIKQGEIGVGTLVEIDTGIVVTEIGLLAGGSNIFVRDRNAQTFGGLRVGAADSFTRLPRGERALLVGTVATDELGLVLRPQSMEPGGFSEEPAPPRTELRTLVPGEPTREGLLDMVLEVHDETGAAIVVGEQLEPQVFAIADGIVIDLRPFSVDEPALQSGISLASITGVVVDTGKSSAILPRGTTDLVFSR